MSLFAIGWADVKFAIDTTWTNKCWVEPSDMVGSCKQKSAFAGRHAIDRIEQTTESDFAPFILSFFAFQKRAVDILHQDNTVDGDRAKEF